LRQSEPPWTPSSGIPSLHLILSNSSFLKPQ
jgi:hypothetical protein